MLSSLIFLVSDKTDYVYNDANQMTTSGAQSIDVDVNGNVTNDGTSNHVFLLGKCKWKDYKIIHV